MNIIWRGLVSYHCTLNGRLSSGYAVEQQAQIIADNCTLENERYYGWAGPRITHDITPDGDITESAIREKCKQALRGFLW